MNDHLRKVGALFRKDFADTFKNVNVSILLILPIFFALLYSMMDFGGERMPASFVLTVSVLMNVCLVPANFLSMTIAEEKEKHTLRTLMLSNVSAGEFLVSKALVTYLFMQAVNLVVFFVTGQGLGELARFVGVTTLGSVCMIMIGAAAGILSKDQMSTSVITLPFSLAFLIPPMFAGANEVFTAIARFVPTTAMMNLFLGAPENPAWYDATGYQVLIIGLWTAAALAAFVLIYRKKRLDN
ncbi:MAG: ABC transporter permease [Christensenellales bacterium]|jgi:ABC-2 type transport system permease protein